MSAEKSVRCPLCNRDPVENYDEPAMPAEARQKTEKKRVNFRESLDVM